MTPWNEDATILGVPNPTLKIFYSVVMFKFRGSICLGTNGKLLLYEGILLTVHSYAHFLLLSTTNQILHKKARDKRNMMILLCSSRNRIFDYDKISSGRQEAYTLTSQREATIEMPRFSREHLHDTWVTCITEHRQKSNNIIWVVTSYILIFSWDKWNRKGTWTYKEVFSPPHTRKKRRPRKQVVEGCKPNAHPILNHTQAKARKESETSTKDQLLLGVLTKLYNDLSVYKGLSVFCAKKLVFPVAQWMCIANPLSHRLS